MAISQVQLINFRNHSNLELKCDPNLNMMIIGNNGVGKTNLLEALSLLSPGKGLKNASSNELIQTNCKEFFLSIDICHKIQSKIKIFSQDKKKKIKIDDKMCTSFSELISIIKVMWITPQMNSIFCGEKALRRKFFDRIVAHFFPKHIEHLIHYDHLKSERIKLLKEKLFDDIWITHLEASMSELGIEIAMDRTNALSILQRNIDEQVPNFIKSTLMIEGFIEEMLKTKSKNEAQNIYLNKLKNSRNIDSMLKKTTFGVHNSDFYSIYKKKDLRSSLCSTGEQKLLLLSIIIAALQENYLLLLDDIIEHIDQKNFLFLMEAMLEKKCQIWITSINVPNNKIFPMKEFSLHMIGENQSIH